ncbi:MAG TPA: hypothetical protein VGX48_18320 [Pyrinomonadaceae bacterium]|jgi:hypothetical protein|nr:hypothetical protein [Pyrinomonadaceae bacterium]
MPLSDAALLRKLFAAAALCLWLAGGAARAQSSDPSFPAPVFSNEVTGRIAPRDVGDPRRTRHFYTFRGVEGDLVITFESAELIGDVDLFTASTQRPLLKFTLYGGTTAAVSKSVYLRAEQSLVLRVEARAVGDVEGSYRIRFSGSFAPAPAGLAQAPEPPTVAATETARAGTRRVTSTGARIEEPPAETAAATPEPTPEPTPAEATPTPTPRPPRRVRNPRNSRRQQPAARPPADAAEARTEGAEAPPSTTPPAEETKPEAENAESARPARNTSRRRSRPARRNTPADEGAAASGPPAEGTPPATEATPPEPAPPGQRLVIVTKDGEIVVREMSKVRRVTVDNNQLVVVMKDGKVIRQPLTNLERMSIEP